MIQALEFIYSRNLVHMDVKADNIMVCYEGHWCQLGDFGATIKQGGTVHETTLMFAPEEILGKVAETKYDWHMLAVAIMTLLHWDTWKERLFEEDPKTKRKFATANKLCSLVPAVEDSELKSLLENLLLRAGYC
eukprot:Em0018g192a